MERDNPDLLLMCQVILAVFLLGLVLTWCRTPFADDGDGVPEGFEDLVEPQTNVVDVYYNGEPITAAVATYAPGTIEFDDPEAIVAEMADLGDRAMVLGALSGPLPTHASLICLGSEATSDTGCGRLIPDVAGVIFNRNSFRADIFVDSAYRQIQAQDGARFLHPSEDDPAILSFLTGIVSGGDNQELDYDVLNRTIVGQGDNRAVADLIYDNRDGFFIDEGRFIADREAWRYEAGLFRTAPLEAVSQEKIVGVSVGTQLDSRLDLDLVTGTPLIIFLPVRSKVDVFGNGRLLSSETYDAGNQTLNTASLPPGSYEVTLRITEIGGTTREETRFFAKTLDLPPDDAPLYVFQFGQLINDDFRGRGEPVTGTVPIRPCSVPARCTAWTINSAGSPTPWAAMNRSCCRPAACTWPGQCVCKQA